MPASIRTLGTVLAKGAEGVLAESLLAQPKRVGVLGYLILSGRRRWVPRQELLGHFWPESDEARARKALSQALWVLRSEFGEGVLRKRGAADVSLDPEGIDVDVWRFLDSLEAGDDAGAMAAYGGEFLPGLVVSGAPSFERWLEEERSRLRSLARDAAWRLQETAEAPEDALRWAREAYQAAGPWDEEAARRLMGALAAAGDLRAAEDLYDALARGLAAEGDAPHPATRDFVETLRRSTPAGRPRPHAGAGPGDRAPSAAARDGSDGGSSTGEGRAPGPASRWASVAAVAALLLSLAVPFALALRERSALALGPAGSSPTVAVTPFEVEGSEELGYLGTAMADLLASRLDGAGELVAMDPGAVLAAAGSASGQDAARAVADSLAPALIVTGSVVALGGSVEIRASATNAAGRLAGRAHVVATAEEGLSEALDTLALALLAGVLEGSPNSLDYGASKETRSLPALKAYLRGEAAFRSFRLDEAAEAFREAVALDSAFALAHLQLNRVGDWLEDGTLTAALDQAILHRDRLPRRHRRLLDAHVEFWRRSVPEGIRLLEQAVAGYPTDADAWFQLGDARFHGGPRLGRSILEAEAPFRRALDLNPRDHRAALHLVGLAAYRGDVDEARRLASLIPAADPARVFQLAVLSIPSDAPLEAFRTHLAALPAPLTNAVYSPADFLERPDLLGAAGERLEDTSGPGPSRLLGLQLQALAAAAEGRPDRARAVLARMGTAFPSAAAEMQAYFEALPWAPPPPPGWTPAAPAARLEGIPRLFAEGVLALRAGLAPRLDSIRTALGEVRGAPPHTVATTVLSAEVALAEGRPADGLALLDEARRTLNGLQTFSGLMTFPHAWERFLRARLLEAVGRDEEAASWYGTMASPVAYTLVFAAPAHLARATVLERLGRGAEAADARRRAERILRRAEPEGSAQTVTSRLGRGASPLRPR